MLSCYWKTVLTLDPIKVWQALVSAVFLEAVMRFKNQILASIFSAVLSFGMLSPAHGAGELEHVTLAVYVNPAGAPQGFLEDNLLHPRGVEIDIVYELQRRLMFNLKENRIYTLQRLDCFERLRNGTADLVVGGISYTPERAKTYDFTPIFWESSLGVMYSTRRNVLRSEQDLKGKRIGVERGSTAEEYASKLGATPVQFSNLTLACFLVAIGELDGLIYDRPPIEDFARTVKSANLAVTETPFGQEACMFAFALSKDSPYTEVISNTINQMKEDGTIASILKKWNTK